MPNLSEHHRRHIIELLEQGRDLPPDYKHLLFPPERQEYELVYACKERDEDILAETLAVPLQRGPGPLRHHPLQVVPGRPVQQARVPERGHPHGVVLPAGRALL